jgi:hypothetical protein
LTNEEKERLRMAQRVLADAELDAMGGDPPSRGTEAVD